MTLNLRCIILEKRRVILDYLSILDYDVYNLYFDFSENHDFSTRKLDLIIA